MKRCGAGNNKIEGIMGKKNVLSTKGQFTIYRNNFLGWNKMCHFVIGRDTPPLLYLIIAKEGVTHV